MKKALALVLLLSAASNMNAAGSLLNMVQGPHTSTALMAGGLSAGIAMARGGDRAEATSEFLEAAAISEGMSRGVEQWDATLLTNQDPATCWGSRAAVAVVAAGMGAYGEYKPLTNNAIPAPLRALLGMK